MRYGVLAKCEGQDDIKFPAHFSTRGEADWKCERMAAMHAAAVGWRYESYEEEGDPVPVVAGMIAGLLQEKARALGLKCWALDIPGDKRERSACPITFASEDTAKEVARGITEANAAGGHPELVCVAKEGYGVATVPLGMKVRIVRRGSDLTVELGDRPDAEGGA